MRFLETPKSAEPKRAPSKEPNCRESTANKHRQEKENPSLPNENSDNDSELDEDDRSLVSLLNRVTDGGDSIAPSDSVSGVGVPTNNLVRTKEVRPRVLQQPNNSPPASQSSILSGLDNDSIAPFKRNKRKINPEEKQKVRPSSSRIQYESVAAITRPGKRKSESPGSSPRKKRQQWTADEDRLLKKGFLQFRNSKFIWNKIKSKLFSDSTRTNVNLKDRARTLGLK